MEPVNLSNNSSIVREARYRAHELFVEVQVLLKKKYTCTGLKIGSTKYGIIVTDTHGIFDIDYMIDISEAYSFDPISIRSDFYESFRSCISSYELIKNNSTAITVRVFSDISHTHEKYSFDFVLTSGNRIIRESSSGYVWNQFDDHHNAFALFDRLSSNVQQSLVQNYIIPEKIELKRRKAQNPSISKSSIDVFVEQVLNYYQRR